MSSSTADPTAEDAQPPAGRAPSEPRADPHEAAEPESPAVPRQPATLEPPAGPEQVAESAPADAPAPAAQPGAQAALPDGPPDGSGPSGADAAPAGSPLAAADPGQPPPFSKMAIAALPAGILPLVPVGIGLGITGLVTTRRGRRRGRGLALAGLLTATTWLAIGIAVGTVAALTHGFHKPTRVEYSDGLGTVFTLRPGDCVTGLQSNLSPSLTSCSSPHDAEVFATFALPGTSWPGAGAVQQEAGSGCSSRLAGYLNPELSISLSQDYIYPGQVAWQTGTRTVICEVRATTGQLTQSVKGAS